MSLKHLKSILKSFKNFAIACFFGWLIFSPVPEENTNQPKQSKQSIELLSITGGHQENTSSVQFSPVVSSSTQSSSKPKVSSSRSKSFSTESERVYEVGRSVDNLDEKKFFREMLAKHFPDWNARVSIEKQEARIYYKAIRKLKEYKKFQPLLKNHQNWLTDEEKSAIDYFHGRGKYKKYQDPKIPPNPLDTRKTFLKKMEDKEMREKFLEYYNRMNPIQEN